MRLPVEHDDAAIVAGLVAGDRWASAALFDRYAQKVEKILRRLCGRDADLDLEDLLHETFVRAFSAAKSLDDPQAVEAWIRTIAARTAYRAIRNKQTRRWLRFWEPDRVAATEGRSSGPELRDACARTLRVLSSLRVEERVAFSLRFIEGMELLEIADVCECSLATVKRRLKRAKARFVSMAG
ncbi:MAG: sigma-70 family RNA polymerase sigma factor, partial [Polyangiaceae bacterium]